MLRKVRTFIHILVLPFSGSWSSVCPGHCSRCWKYSRDQRTKVKRGQGCGWCSREQQGSQRLGQKAQRGSVPDEVEGGQEGNMGRWDSDFSHWRAWCLCYWRREAFLRLWADTCMPTDSTGVVLRMDSRGQEQMQCDCLGRLFVKCRHGLSCLE